MLLLNHTHSVHLFGMYFRYQWRYLLLRCMQNITPGRSDASVVGTNTRWNWTAYTFEITKHTYPTSDHTNLTNPSDHTLVCQTGFFFFKDILHLDVNDHTTVSQAGFFYPVYETVVWSLTFWVENVFEKKKNEKTRSVRPRYGHWQTGSKTWLKKMTGSVRQWYFQWWVKNHIIGSIIPSKDSLSVKICIFKKNQKILKTMLQCTSTRRSK